MDFEDGNIALTTMSAAQKQNCDYWDSDDEDQCGSVASELKKFKVSNIAPKSKWVKLQESPQELWFMQEKFSQKPNSSGDKNDDAPRVTTIVLTYTFKSNASVNHNFEK
jgi:hypothetical protein